MHELYMAWRQAFRDAYHRVIHGMGGIEYDKVLAYRAKRAQDHPRHLERDDLPKFFQVLWLQLQDVATRLRLQYTAAARHDRYVRFRLNPLHSLFMWAMQAIVLIIFVLVIWHFRR